MSGPAATRLDLPKKLRRAVERLSRSASKPHRLVVRAKLIRMACLGTSNAEIARRLQITPQTVRKWRARIDRERKLVALDDVQRSGRLARIPVEVRCAVIKLACAKIARGSLLKCVARSSSWRARRLREDKIARRTVAER
jgi:DNA-binding CsgD family transcriptional regulator